MYPIKQKIPKTPLKIVAFAVMFFITTGLFASHFRYGDISWRVVESDPTGRTIEFKVNTGWRLNAVDPLVLYFGDGGNSGYIYPSYTNINGEYSYNTVTVRHRYGSNGNYTAYYSGCCKISNLANNRDQSWYVRTNVNVGSGNNSPVTTVPAIVNLQTNQGAATFNIPAADPDGDNLTFALANYSQHGWPYGSSHPSGLSIDQQAGQVTFNTNGKAIGSLWNTAVAISDGSTTIIVDFIIKITQTSTPPKFDYSVTPANNQVYNASPGQTVSFDIKAFDTDPGSHVNINGIGVPSGASVSPAFGTNGNPVQHSFSWTPNVNQFGTYVMNFVAQDNNGVQTQTSVSIIVSLKPRFDVPPTPAEGDHLIADPGDAISYTVQASDPDPADLVNITKVEGKDASGHKIPLYSGASFSPLPSAAGNPTAGTFTWQTQASDWGHKHVYFTATDSYGDQAVHEVSQLLNTPPAFTSAPVPDATVGQAYAYHINVNDPDLAHGDQLSIHGVGLPAWLSLIDNGDGTALLAGTPAVGDAGTVHIQIQAEDMHHHEDTRGVVIQDYQLEVENCTISLTAKNTSVALDANGQASIDPADILGSASATCGPLTYSVSPTSFDCSNIGDNTVILTVTDHNNNVSTATAIVTIEDNAAPVVACPSDASASTSISGTALAKVNGNNVWVSSGSNFTFNDPVPAGATVTKIDVNYHVFGYGTAHMRINAGGTHIGDAYPTSGTQTKSVSRTGEFPNYNYGGTNTLTLYSWWNSRRFIGAAITIHYSSASGSCGSVVAVQAPMLIEEACDVTITNDYNNTADASGFYPVGTTVVNWNIMDANGNSTSCQQVVTVTDNTAPSALAQNITLQLDASGNASITAADVDNGSNDDCGISSMSVNPSSFSCADVGANTVELTVVDSNGNSSVASAIVTVEDNVPPVAIAQDVIVHLDVNGEASITAADVNDASTDACGIADVSVHPMMFGCSDLGNNTVTLTVMDIHGNKSTATATLTVEDDIAPTITCPADIAVVAQPNDCSPQVFWTVPTVWDNCDYTVASNYNPGDRFEEGVTTVQYTVADAAGNTTSCSFEVEVSVTPLTLSLSSPTYNGGWNISCNGMSDGSIEATVDGGCLPYTIAWSEGAASKNITGVGAGTHTLLVTDAKGRTISETITLTEPDPLVSSIAASPQYTVSSGVNEYTIYLGYGIQTIDMVGSVIGGTPEYNYSWAPAAGLSSTSTAATQASPSVPTLYTLTVTDENGCVSIESFFVDVIDARCGKKLDKVMVCHETSEKRKGETVVSYNELCVSPNAVAAHLAHGDKLGPCLSTKSAVDEQDDNLAQGMDYTIYPNPTSDELNIQINGSGDKDHRIVVSDMSGKILEVINGGTVGGQAEYLLDLSAYEDGMYLVRIITSDQTFTDKVIKR